MASDAAGWRAKALFDRASYDRMNEETGGAGLDIAETLLAVATGRRAAMIEAARAGEAGDLSRLAHAMKSGARSLGLLRLAELCDMIERLPPGETAALCPDIEREFDAAIAVLTELRQE